MCLIGAAIVSGRVLKPISERVLDMCLVRVQGVGRVRVKFTELIVMGEDKWGRRKTCGLQSLPRKLPSEGFGNCKSGE